MTASLTGPWRPARDENKNWKIVYKTNSSDRRQMGDVGKSVLWTLQNAPRPLTVIEIVSQLAVEGEALHPWDQARERDRVRKVLGHLRAKGLVKSISTIGARLTWKLGENGLASAGRHSEQTSLHRGKKLSDRDWMTIKRTLPPHARTTEGKAGARRFIEIVINDISLEGATALLPSEQKRFWAWHHLGVWRAISIALGHKLSATDLAALVRKLGAVGVGDED